MLHCTMRICHASPYITENNFKINFKCCNNNNKIVRNTEKNESCSSRFKNELEVGLGDVSAWNSPCHDNLTTSV